MSREMYRYHHSNTVTGLAFHPKEYAMVSCSTDKTLKFVDLDQPSNMNTSPVDAHPLRAIAFDNEGTNIFSANTEMLKVGCLLACSCLLAAGACPAGMTCIEARSIAAMGYCNEGADAHAATQTPHWHAMLLPRRSMALLAVVYVSNMRHAAMLQVWKPEPLQLQDIVDVRWTHLGDMIYMQDKNKVMGVSFNQCMLGVWSIDCSKVKPWRVDVPANVPDYVTVRQSRATGDSSRGPSQADSLQGAMPTRAPGNRRSTSSNSISAAAPAALPAPAPAPAPAPPPEYLSPLFNPSLQEQQAQQQRSHQQQSSERPRMVSAGTAVGESLAGQLVPSSSTPVDEAGKPKGRVAGGSSRNDFEVEIRIPATRPAPDALDASTAAVSSRSRQSSRPGARECDPLPSYPSSTATPPSAYTSTPAVAAAAGSTTDLDVISRSLQGHGTALATLERRVNSLGMIKERLARQDIRGACSVVQVAADVGIDSELISRLPRHRQIFALEMLPLLVHPLQRVLAGGTEQQAEDALRLLMLVLNGFGEIIKSTCSQEGARGVDLEFENRRQRCEVAKMALKSLEFNLSVLQRKGGVVAHQSQSLLAQLQDL
jgi:hypothetical protein